MIAKLKLIGIGLLGLITSILYALLQREKKERAQEQADAEEAARAVENANSVAIINGLEKEAKVKNEKVDTTQFTDHFS